MIRPMTQAEATANNAQIVRWVEEIAEESDVTVADVLGEWDAHHKWAWVVDGRLSGIILGRYHGTKYSISACAGVSEARWAELASELERIGKEMGGTHLEMKGRRGFVRIFRRYGWTESFTVIDKEL